MGAGEHGSMGEWENVPSILLPRFSRSPIPPSYTHQCRPADDLTQHAAKKRCFFATYRILLLEQALRHISTIRPKSALIFRNMGAPPAFPPGMFLAYVTTWTRRGYAYSPRKSRRIPGGWHAVCIIIRADEQWQRRQAGTGKGQKDEGDGPQKKRMRPPGRTVPLGAAARPAAPGRTVAVPALQEHPGGRDARQAAAGRRDVAKGGMCAWEHGQCPRRTADRRRRGTGILPVLKTEEVARAAGP